MDMLILSGGIGSGWVKNSFVSDIIFKLGLGFSRKGMMKNIYSAEWNMMYVFSDSNENKFFELNHFVSIGWEHKLFKYTNGRQMVWHFGGLPGKAQ